VSVFFVPPLFIHPYLDEFRFHEDVIIHGRASFLNGRNRIGYIHSRRVTLSPEPGQAMPVPAVRNTAALGSFTAHLQGHRTPIRAATMQVRTIFQIAYANRCADPVVRQPLHMVDEVIAGKEFLGHGPFGHVLETEVSMEIGHRRHDGLARQVDMRRPRRGSHVAAPADACELIVFDDECGVFDGALPSPVISRAPSNIVTLACGLAFRPHAMPQRTDTSIVTKKVRRCPLHLAHGNLLRIALREWGPGSTAVQRPAGRTG